MYHNQKISRQAKDLLRRCGFYRPHYTEVNEFTALLGSGNNNGSKFSVALEAHKVMEQGLNLSHIMLYLEHQEKQGMF